MTTPQQDEPVTPLEQIKDFEVPADAQEHVAGGDAMQAGDDAVQAGGALQDTAKSAIGNIH